MRELEAEPGTSIGHAAEKLVAVAQTEDCFLIFNGICVTATKRSTVESICNDYDRLCEIARKEYEASPKGIAAKQRAESERQALQEEADRLMLSLDSLDFTDLDACMRWLCDIEDARDRIGVNVDAKKIQDTFRSHGFEPGAYCGDDFVKGSPEIEARWLIGQAIADQYVPLVRHFYSQLVKPFDALEQEVK